MPVDDQSLQSWHSLAHGRLVAEVDQLGGSARTIRRRQEAHRGRHASIVWNVSYPFFRSHHIPEIQDLNVVPHLRRRGVASIDEAEKRVSINHKQVGIAVGLHPAYRVAQPLYAVRSYLPDGQGVFWRDRFPEEGETVVLDDALLLHFTKGLG